MDQFEVLATKAPVMLVAGNHERDFPNSGDRYNTAIDSGICSIAPQPLLTAITLQSALVRESDVTLLTQHCH